MAVPKIHFQQAMPIQVMSNGRNVKQYVPLTAEETVRPYDHDIRLIDGNWYREVNMPAVPAEMPKPLTRYDIALGRHHGGNS